jgi:hypothetical protein
MPAIPYVRATHSDGQSWSAAKANLLEAGVNDVSYAPVVRVYHNTTQSITNATDTTLAFNSERVDQAGNAADTMHDNTTNNSRLTCRYAGFYLIFGHASWASAPTSANIWIRVNGATDIGKSGVGATGGNYAHMSLMTGYQLAVNDYVELRVRQDSGGAINISSTANMSPEFGMVRVG